MKNKCLLLLAGMAVVALALTSTAVAQEPHRATFKGTISDYTTGTKPWEMRGTWSLEVHGYGKADFTAALNMEHSDMAVINGATRVPHTHHITMRNAQVMSDPSFVAANCPSTQYSPATTDGFAVVGMASVTGNGAFAPFAPNGELSELMVCVTGSTQKTYSNLTLVFPANNPDNSTDRASTHFGTQPINGVVVKIDSDHDRDRD